jgi:DNA-binding transcriptional LysR family regulator
LGTVGRVELRQLRAFVVIAEERHFARAAARLGIAQPSLSRQLRRLEDELGVELLVRTSRRLSLTEAGAAFLLRARETLAHAELSVAAARRAGAGELGHLRVGAVDWALNGMLPGLLRGFSAARPAVTLDVHDLGVAQQLAELHDRRLDVAFIHAPYAGDALRTASLGAERLMAILPAGHPLADAGEVPLAALADTRLVLRGPATGGGARQAVLELLARAGVGARVAQEPDGLDAVLALVAAGTGVSVQPEPVTALLRADVVALPLAGDLRTPPLEVAWRADEASSLVGAFVEAARAAAGATDVPADVGAAGPAVPIGRARHSAEG